jgi:hypothetical protein
MTETYICPMKEYERPSVTVKLKPYLQEYLLCELRTNMASKRNIIGILLHPFLEKRPAGIPPFIPEGPDYITFLLPGDHKKDIRGNLWVSPDNQQLFERFLEWHFKQLFFHYMNYRVNEYKSFKKAILQFCIDHEFTFSNINYEMLKKDYYRKRKRKNIEKSFPQTVPGFFRINASIFITLN